MPTRLSYSFITSPTPLLVSPAGGAPATATLRLIATNATREKEVVRLEALSFRVPVGPEAGQLTATSASIAPVPPPGWELHNVKTDPGSATYIFYPLTVPFELLPAQGLVFTLDNLQPNTAVGTASVLVTEGTAGKPTTSLEISKCPPSWDGLSFGVTPLTVAAGTGVQLTWRGPAGADFTYRMKYYDFATDAEVTLPLPGKPAFGPQGTYPGLNDPALAPTQSTTFTLVVSAVIGGQPVSVPLQARVEVIVPPPRFGAFRIEPNPITIGQPRPAMRLSWQTTNAVTVSVEGHSFTGAEARQGSLPIAPQKTRRYVGQAYGATGGPPAPATANAWASYQHLVEVKVSVSFAGPVPTLVNLPAAGDVFRLSAQGIAGQSVDSTLTPEPNPVPPPPTPVYHWDWRLELLPGVEVADLSAFGPLPTYDNLIAATYGRSVAHDHLGRTTVENFSRSISWLHNWAFPFGSWGIRLPNGGYGLLQVQVAEAVYDSDGEDFSKTSVRLNITFRWIPYEADSLAAEDEGPAVE